MFEKVWTPDEVAEYLQVRTLTVREWLREGKLGAIKVGKQWRIRDRDIAALLEEGL